MDRTTKIILGIIAGFIVLCLCVCVVGAFVPQIIGPVLKQAASMTENPQEVAQIAGGIVDYQLPPGYREQFGMSFFGFDMVGFSPEDIGQQFIMLIQFPAYAGLDQAQMEQRAKQSFNERMQQEEFQMQVVEHIDATIRDQRVTLTVSEGANAQGVAYRQVTGFFEGKKGPVMLMIMGEKQKWDQGAVNLFLTSLQ